MWIKNLMAATAAAVLTCSLSAADAYRCKLPGVGPARSQNVLAQTPRRSPGAALTARRAAPAPTPGRPAGKFNPQIPILSEEAVKKVMDGIIKKQLLQREISEDIAECRKNGYFSRLDCNSLLTRYQILMNNFELPEVTGVPRSWYEDYGKRLRTFELLTGEMDRCVRYHEADNYAAAVRKFKAHQQGCLAFLKERRPRITPDALKRMQTANTKKRAENYAAWLRRRRELREKQRQQRLAKLAEEKKRKAAEKAAALKEAGKKAKKPAAEKPHRY